MTNAIRRELHVPQPRVQVWQALATSDALAEWMFPNDFQPEVGRRFTFQVPPNPRLNFPGLTVRCEVLECLPPSRLSFSWSAGAPVENTVVRFDLESDGDGTRIHFEHAGFDLAHAFGQQALQGAEYGWAKMFKSLEDVVGRPSASLTAERVLPFSPHQVFAAFERPALLAEWWGPNGFRNTFEKFEFEPGGRWVFVMHGPNGVDYPNENLFRALEPGAKVVLEHIHAPWFTLKITLAPHGEHTQLAWVQTFENADTAAKISAAIGRANEENLDRLQAVLTREYA